VLGNRTNLLDLGLDISGNEWAVATDPAIEVNKMISAYTKLILYCSPKFLMTSSTYWTR
jgi:hypothetical protein